jgi:hypothetical protein
MLLGSDATPMDERALHSVFPEHLYQEVRTAVDDAGVVGEIVGGVDEPQQLHETLYASEIAEMRRQDRQKFIPVSLACP